MSVLRAQEFPVGPTPGWETEGEREDSDEEGELQSVPHSYIVYTSLKQSRANWLTSTFPKFNSKPRGGKTSDIAVPPAHTAKLLGKCTLQVGPHIFSETSIYEVHYVPASRPTITQGYYPAASGTWQTTTPQSHAPIMPYAPQLANAPPRASTPLVSSLAKNIAITPALMDRVNHEAQTNLTLANFITLAATGKATNDQLKMLGLFIQSLAELPSTTAQHVQPAPSTSNGPFYMAQAREATPSYGNFGYAPYHYPVYPQYAQAPPPPLPPVPTPPTKPHDVILEFKEKPYDRWFFPRGIVFCERTPSEGPPSEILVSAALPFPSAASLTQAPGASPAPEPEVPKEVVTFRFTSVTESIWDGLLTWAGGHDKMLANREILSSIAQAALPRAFLRHQLPKGDLLSQFQQLASSPYVLKPLKASSGDKPRRRKRPPRKPVADKERKEDRAPSASASAPASVAPTVTPTTPAPPKRKQTPSAKIITVPPKIACHSCGQTDVPLFIGGRFCQACKDSGKVPADLGIPPAPSGTLASYYSIIARSHYSNIAPVPTAQQQSGPSQSYTYPSASNPPMPRQTETSQNSK